MQIVETYDGLIPYIEILCENDYDYVYLAETFIKQTYFENKLSYIKHLKEQEILNIPSDYTDHIISFIKKQDRKIKLENILC